jgi:hypothetical protein
MKITSMVRMFGIRKNRFFVLRSVRRQGMVRFDFGEQVFVHSSVSCALTPAGRPTVRRDSAAYMTPWRLFIRFSRHRLVEWACGSSVPRLEGGLCGVGIVIDNLEVRQTPKIEQLRPGHAAVFAPHAK